MVEQEAQAFPKVPRDPETGGIIRPPVGGFKVAGGTPTVEEAKIAAAAGAPVIVTERPLTEAEKILGERIVTALKDRPKTEAEKIIEKTITPTAPTPTVRDVLISEKAFKEQFKEQVERRRERERIQAEERLRKFEQRVEALQDREREFFAGKGIERIKTTSRYIVASGKSIITGKPQLPVEPETFAGKVTEDIVAGAAGFPIVLGGTLPLVGEKIAATAEALTMKETRPQVLPELFRAGKETIKEFNPRTVGGASLLISAGLFGLIGAGPRAKVKAPPKDKVVAVEVTRKTVQPEKTKPIEIIKAKKEIIIREPEIGRPEAIVRKAEAKRAAGEQILEEFISGERKPVVQTPAKIRRAVRKSIIAKEKIDAKPVGIFGDIKAVVEPKAVIKLRAKEAKAAARIAAKEQLITDIKKGIVKVGEVRPSIKKIIRKDIVIRLTKEGKPIKSVGPFAEQIPRFEPTDVFRLRFKEKQRAARKEAEFQLLEELKAGKVKIAEVRPSIRKKVRKDIIGRLIAEDKLVGAVPPFGKDVPIITLAKPPKPIKPIRVLKPTKPKQPKPKPTDNFIQKKAGAEQVLLLEKPKQVGKTKIIQDVKVRQDVKPVEIIEIKTITKQLPKAKVKTRSLIIPIAKEKAAVKPRVDIAFIQKPAVKQKVKPALEAIAIPMEKVDVKPQQKIKVGLLQDVKFKELTKVQQKIKQKVSSKITTRKTDIVPKPKRPPRTVLEFDIDPKTARLTPDLMPDSKKGFGVFVKRKGKFERLEGVFGKETALDIGTRVVKETLAATFLIKPVAGKPIKAPTGEFRRAEKEFREFVIRKGQKIPTPLQFVQKRGTRLGTRKEVKAIQTAKRSSFISKGRGAL